MPKKKRSAPDQCCIYLQDSDGDKWYLTPTNTLSRIRYEAGLHSPSAAMKLAQSITVQPGVSRVVELWPV